MEDMMKVIDQMAGGNDLRQNNEEMIASEEINDSTCSGC